MPALLTHQFIAEKTLELLPEGLIKDIPHYYFGAQGGDPFYSYKYITVKKRVNFGMALHRSDIYRTFENFRKYLQKSDDFAAFSYVLGYITHYAADIIFHPFVYCLIERYRKTARPERVNDKIHYLIESDIDVYLLQKIKGELPNAYRYPLTFDSLNASSLFMLFEKAYLDLCGEALNFTAFRRTVKRFFFFNSILEDKNHRKRKFITSVENLFKMSHILSFLFRREEADEAYLNIENSIWHNLESPDNVKKHSAGELFTQAAQLSSELICAFLISLKNARPLEPSKFSTDFNTGIK